MTKGTSTMNSTSSSPTPASSTTRTFHYLHPDSRDEVFIKDPKQSPLALLAQACNNIGKELEASSNLNHRPVVGSADENLRTLRQSSHTYSPPLNTSRNDEINTHGKRSFPGSVSHEDVGKRSKKSSSRSGVKSTSQISNGPVWNANKCKNSSPSAAFSQEVMDLTNEKRYKQNFVEEDRLSSSCGRSTVTPDVSPNEFSQLDLMKWSSKLSETSASSILTPHHSSTIGESVEAQKRDEKSAESLPNELISHWMNWMLLQQITNSMNNNTPPSGNASNIFAMWQKVAAGVPHISTETSSILPKSVESTLSNLSNNMPSISQPLFTPVATKSPSVPNHPNQLMQILAQRQQAITSLPTASSVTQLSPIPTKPPPAPSHVPFQDAPALPDSPGVVQYCMFCGRHCPTFQEWLTHVSSHGPSPLINHFFNNSSLPMSNMEALHAATTVTPSTGSHPPPPVISNPSILHPLLLQQQKPQNLDTSSPTNLSPPFSFHNSWPFPLPHPLTTLGLPNGLTTPFLSLPTSTCAHLNETHNSTFSSLDSLMEHSLKLPFLNGSNSHFASPGSAVNSASLPTPCFTC